MLPTRFVYGRTLPILLTLLLLTQAPHSFSSESCQTEECSRSVGYQIPSAALFMSLVRAYHDDYVLLLVAVAVSAVSFSWPETLNISVSKCNVQPFELWKPKLGSEFCQSLISSKNRSEAVKLLRETGAMEPATMACNNWQTDLADYFNWRWPGNNASQWQEIPLRYSALQGLSDKMYGGKVMDLLIHFPSVSSLSTIQINGQQYILKGYANSGFMIAPMLKVAECYFVPEEEPVAFGFDEWSGLVDGRIHSLFKAVKGHSLEDWVAESRKPSSKVDIDAMFSGFGQILAQFHLRHRDSELDGLSTLSRAVHRDLHFNNVFYDEKSGFSLIDTLGLSVSVLEPSEVRLDLKRLFEDMNRHGISKSGFIRTYIGQWPEVVQESLQEQIESL